MKTTSLAHYSTHDPDGNFEAGGHVAPNPRARQPRPASPPRPPSLVFGSPPLRGRSAAPLVSFGRAARLAGRGCWRGGGSCALPACLYKCEFTFVYAHALRMFTVVNPAPCSVGVFLP